MTNVSTLAETAAAAAARLRMRYKRGLFGAICPLDLSIEMGLEVRLEAVPSLEAIYRPGDEPLILLNTLRPSGRRAYNCAHELGHHVFGHGTSIDVLVGDASDVFDPEEYLADRFAAALLMPKLAVTRAFALRGWAAGHSTPKQVFAIAKYLGVGYATLLGHLENTLMELSAERAQALRRASPRSIRREICGREVGGDITIVDEHWEDRPIDVEVGDTIVVPTGSRIRGSCIGMRPDGVTIDALRSGTGIVDLGDTPLVIRVARRQFRGLVDYRFEQDPDDEEA